MTRNDGDASGDMVVYGHKVGEEARRRGKAVMERLMTGERERYLAGHPEDKGNGFQEGMLLASPGLLPDPGVPRIRSGGFRPALLPGRRRASVDPGYLIPSCPQVLSLTPEPNPVLSVDSGDLVLLISRCGISTRKVRKVLEGCCGASRSHKKHLPLSKCDGGGEGGLRDAPWTCPVSVDTSP